MKILVDCIPYDHGESGISVYVRSVVRELAALGNELTLLIEPDNEVFFPGFKTVAAPRWTRHPAGSMFWHLFMLPFKIKSEKYDFMLITAANRRALAFYRLFTIAVVHDLAQYHIAGKYSPSRMFYLKHILPIFVRRAPHCVAVSYSTAADMVKYWCVPEKNISVCYNGIEAPVPGDGHWCEKQKLTPGKYLLYISRIEYPGKNHVNLISAFAGLPEELRHEYHLVLAGADWKDADVVKAAAAALPDHERIIFPGFIADSDLFEAYHNAALYVFPSFFEGFGLSLVEAMKCLTPCACSNNSSLGELGRNAALLFDPADPGAIAKALERGLTDVELRKKLIAAGEERAAEFDWRKHARRLLDICENTTR